jgi:hypothetical protein
VALSALRRAVTVTIPAGLKQTSQARLVEVAKAQNLKVLAEQKQRFGVEPKWTGFGDVPGKPVEQAEKMVVFKYIYLQEIIQVFLKALRDASPVQSGRYKDSHGLYINGVHVPDDTQIREGEEVWIANPVVYARRLEVGKTESGRDFLVSPENRIYERTASKLASRYANAAKIKMGYVTMPDAYEIKGLLPKKYIAKGGVLRTRRQQVGAPVRSPAIFIDLL